MGFAFIIAGVVFLIAGARDTSSQLLTLLKGDFTGTNNFIYWTIAILVIGSLGYSKSFQSLSRAFLALVIIVLFLAEDKNSTGGFFTEFTSAVKSITGGTT